MDKGVSAGYLAALFATIIWAGNFIAARALAWAIPPFQFNFWRWVIAFVAILPFAIPHLKTDLAHCRRHFPYLTLMALLGVTLMNTFVYKAGQTTESLNMALIMPATPAIILILARIVYKEPISAMRMWGMVAAMIGILILISRGDWKTLWNLEVRSGDIWTLGCMLCFALYSLFMRQRPTSITSAGFNVIVFGLGIIYSLPMVAAEMWFDYVPQISASLITGLLYAGVGCSAIAFWLWTVGIDRIGPVAAGIIYYSLPLFAAIMAKVVLDEKVTGSQIFGGVMIIGGIALASVRLVKK